MRYFLLTITTVLMLNLSGTILSASHSPIIPIKLENFKANIYDKTSIKRGANLFAQHCIACHSLKYLHLDPIAHSAGITIDKMPIKNKTWTYSMAPPDLSLIAESRGTQWLYTYLLTFYEDNSRPTGANNLLTPNTAMPNPFFGLQGIQTLTIEKSELIKNGLAPKLRWFNLLELKQKGQLSPHEFEEKIHDLVTFLAYAADPSQARRQRIGWWVLGFLVIFVLLTYLLKKEYWKDIE